MCGMPNSKGSKVARCEKDLMNHAVRLICSWREKCSPDGDMFSSSELSVSARAIHRRSIGSEIKQRASAGWQRLSVLKGRACAGARGLYRAGGELFSRRRKVLPTVDPCHVTVTVGSRSRLLGRLSVTVRYAKTVRQLIDYPGCLGARRRGNHSLSGGHNREA